MVIAKLRALLLMVTALLCLYLGVVIVYVVNDANGRNVRFAVAVYGMIVGAVGLVGMALTDRKFGWRNFAGSIVLIHLIALPFGVMRLVM